MDLTFENHSRKVPGHECTLEERYAEDEMFYGDNLLSRPQRFMRFWQRSFLVSRKHPYTHYFRSIWEIFMVFFYTGTLLIVPFFVFIVFIEVEKRKKYPYALWDDAHLVMFVITLIDIFINLHSGYVTNKTKEIVLDRPRISRHYILTFLFVDIVSSFPLEYLVVVLLRYPWETYYWLRYIQLLRALRIGTLQAYAKQMLARFEASVVVTKSVIACILVTIFIHWVSCIYPLNITSVLNNANAVQNRSNSDVAFSHYISGKNLSWMYIWELKLTLALANMFGCNLEYPQKTAKDLLFRTLVSLYGILLMIYISVQVVMIIKIVRSTSTKYDEKLSQLTEFIKQRRLPQSLEVRLMNFFKFSYPRNYLWEPFAHEFISQQLKQEMMMHICKKLVEKTPIFKGVETSGINTLVSFLTHTIVLANDVLMKSGEPADNMFFISWGSVVLYTETGKEICHLKDGDHFGEFSHVIRDRAEYNAVAAEDTELFVLSRSNFLRAVISHPQLLKRFPEAKKPRWRRNAARSRRD